MKVAIEAETNKKEPPAGDPFFVYYKWQLRSRSGIRHLAFFINSATGQLLISCMVRLFIQRLQTKLGCLGINRINENIRKTGQIRSVGSRTLHYTGI